MIDLKIIIRVGFQVHKALQTYLSVCVKAMNWGLGWLEQPLYILVFLCLNRFLVKNNHCSKPIFLDSTKYGFMEAIINRIISN